MGKAKYAMKDINENCAKAIGHNLPISTKQTIEVCNAIRGMETEKAKRLLTNGIELKVPVPMNRFTNGVGHKRGIGAGSYAPKTCTHLLKLIESVEANAQYKGINSSNLIIKHICPQRSAQQWRYGRKRRQKMKSTNVEIVVEEQETKTKKKITVKPTIKPEPKGKIKVKKAQETKVKSAPVEKTVVNKSETKPKPIVKEEKTIVPANAEKKIEKTESKPAEPKPAEKVEKK